MLTALALPAAAHAATTRYVSTAGADNGACTAKPCASLGYAYRQSAPGDSVEVAGGSYPDQSFPIIAGRTAPAVEFHPAAGATVNLASTLIEGDFVTLRNIHTGHVDIDTKSTSGDVANATVINGGGSGIYIGSAHDVLIQGGSWGPVNDVPLIMLGGGTNVTFDGLDIHDAVATNATVHLECIYASSVQHFTVRNSIFRNCAYFDIFFTQLGGPDPKDVLLENNVFEQTYTYGADKAPYGINVSNWLTKMENFTLRNNTFQTALAIQPTTIVNSKFVSNLGAQAPCEPGITFSHNVWANGTCAPTDKKVAAMMSQFADPANHDWHLKAGAGAIDAGDPTDATPTDRDGYARIGLPDAGAYEYGAGPAPGTPCTCAGTPPPITPGGGSSKPTSGKASVAVPIGTVLSTQQVLTGATLPVSAAPMRRVRVSGVTICKRHHTARCQSAVRVRVTLNRNAKLVLHVRRIGHGGRLSTERILRLAGRTGENLFRVRGAGLAKGSYKLTLVATTSSGSSTPVTLPVRVR